MNMHVCVGVSESLPVGVFMLVHILLWNYVGGGLKSPPSSTRGYVGGGLKSPPSSTRVMRWRFEESPQLHQGYEVEV